MQPVEHADRPDSTLPRTCFVTIGATAGFRPLLDEVASVDFKKKLCNLGYTRLLVQCGPDLEYFNSVSSTSSAACSTNSTLESLNIESFTYTDDIGSLMQLAGPSANGGERGQRGYGVIISHAGSSTTTTC